MEEIWRPVKGFEGYYEVSNLGRVRSIDRKELRRLCSREWREKYPDYWKRYRT